MQLRPKPKRRPCRVKKTTSLISTPTLSLFNCLHRLTARPVEEGPRSTAAPCWEMTTARSSALDPLHIAETRERPGALPYASKQPWLERGFATDRSPHTILALPHRCHPIAGRLRRYRTPPPRATTAPPPCTAVTHSLVTSPFASCAPTHTSYAHPSLCIPSEPTRVGRAAADSTLCCWGQTCRCCCCRCCMACKGLVCANQESQAVQQQRSWGLYCARKQARPGPIRPCSHPGRLHPGRHRRRSSEGCSSEGSRPSLSRPPGASLRSRAPRRPGCGGICAATRKSHNMPHCNWRRNRLRMGFPLRMAS
mmetsp:Transcript_50168/g.112743  ORF Transcript_50168/g.112743 Transcript_50168/m.112743 type:complete len:309 (-) Transcript_50168:254-1180(-)